MPIFMVYLMGFIRKFTKYGRWCDLTLGLVMVGLGLLWHSPLTMAFGGLGIVSFAVDLNGMIQRRSMAYAMSRVSTRRKR